MRVVVAGGGMVGGQLARQLINNNHDVVVIDNNKEVCDTLYAETGVIAVCGSSNRIEILKAAEIAKADVLVAATMNDADNLACTILARSFGVHRIIARLRDPAYENAYKQAGVDAIVRVTDLMVSQMMIEIEQPKVSNVVSIGGGRAFIAKVLIPERAKVIGRRISEIGSDDQFPEECIFIAVYNPDTEEFSIPRGNRVLNENEELFIISTAKNMRKVVDYITATNKQ